MTRNKPITVSLIIFVVVESFKCDKMSIDVLISVSADQWEGHRCGAGHKSIRRPRLEVHFHPALIPDSEASVILAVELQTTEQKVVCAGE